MVTAAEAECSVFSPPGWENTLRNLHRQSSNATDGLFKDDVCLERLRNHPPGSVVAGLKVVVAGFSGVRGLREGLEVEGSRGTVGKPEGRGRNDILDKNMWSKSKYLHVREFF